jgi:RNA-directed DNA polymerase
LGLELKPSKTRITHTLYEHEGQVGFDFLGFNVRQHPVGRRRSGKSTVGQPLGFKTIITPSKDNRRRHLRAIREVVQQNRMAPQGFLISRLNPLIRGWSHYFSGQPAKKVFNTMDALVYAKLRHWAKRRHPNKSGAWVAEKYWHISAGRWDFHDQDGTRLCRHAETPIVRHVKVRDTKSVFDGDWAYWATRLGRHPELSLTEARLLRRQGGRCSWCGLHFTSGDVREIDHILPLTRGGEDVYSNRQLLHGHCHDAKTARDGSLAARGTHDKSQTTEEPDDGKLSRPVLQAGGQG